MITSAEVLDDRLRVTRVIRWTQGWVYLSALEEDDSQPIVVHFSHLLDLDASLVSLRLHIGQYALRSFRGDDWYVFGPVSDVAIDEQLRSGDMDTAQGAIP